jgi:hypothetical protein
MITEQTIDLDGVSVPAEITRVWEDIGGYAVELTASYDAETGRYVARRIVIEGGPNSEVTGVSIRRIAVKQLLRQAVGEKVDPVLATTMIDPVAAGQAGPTTETLQHVAALYRLAVLLGGAPRVSVPNRPPSPTPLPGWYIRTTP